MKMVKGCQFYFSFLMVKTEQAAKEFQFFSTLASKFDIKTF